MQAFPFVMQPMKAEIMNKAIGIEFANDTKILQEVNLNNALLDERVNTSFIGNRFLTEQQREAARNVVRKSFHSEITLLPTH